MFSIASFGGLCFRLQVYEKKKTNFERSVKFVENSLESITYLSNMCNSTQHLIHINEYGVNAWRFDPFDDDETLSIQRISVMIGFGKN